MNPTIAVALPPVPPLPTNGIEDRWYDTRILIKPRNLRWLCCYFTRPLLAFYEQEAPGDLRPRRAIEEAEHLLRRSVYAKRDGSRLEKARNALLCGPRTRGYSLSVFEFTRGESSLGEAAVFCTLFATVSEVGTGDLDLILLMTEAIGDRLGCPQYQRQRVNRISQWVTCQPRLPRTEVTVALAREILARNKWTRVTASAFHDAMMEADLAETHWLLRVLKHPHVINLPARGTMFLDELATGKKTARR